MENTLENKAKFFAQHWGQPVVKWHKDSPLYAVDGTELLMTSLNEERKHYLQLKPLSASSDEIAIQACKILHPLSFTTSAKWVVERDEELGYITVKSKQSHHSFDIDYSDGSITMYQDDHRSDNPLNHFAVCDFWRREGFLIDFNGKTSKEILTDGWAVLEQEA